MARLADLVAGFADVLKVPSGTVKNTAAVLRAGGLLSTGPRGPGAPHMTPTDATNLLLGLMYDDAQDLAAANVKLLRAADLARCVGHIGFDYGGGLADRLPPHDFITSEDGAFTLGEALDRLFDELVRHGTVDWDIDDPTNAGPVDLLYVSNFNFEVSRPGHTSRMMIDAHAVHWNLEYRWADPTYLERRDAEIARGEIPRHELAHLGSYMSRSRSIGDAEIAGLADVLRGQVLNSVGADIPMVPPYESEGPRA